MGTLAAAGLAATAVWAGKLSVAVGASTKAEMPCGAFVVALALVSFVASCTDFSASEGGCCFSNSNDNQGIRYELASCLMKSGDTEALKKLLKQYDEDGSALWLYTQALVAFRENKADNKTEELVKKALSANSHVPAALAGTKKVKSSTSGYITMGGEDEAAHYV